MDGHSFLEGIDYCTPGELVSAFKSLDNAIIPSPEVLRIRIQELSNLYNCHFVPHSTGPSRTTQIYCCRHRTTFYQCKAVLKFDYYPDTHRVFFESCDIQHTHTVGQITSQRMRNQLTKLQREKIKKSTKEGMNAAQIRMKYKLTCSKDALYDARRAELKSMKEKETQNLINEMSSWSHWSNQILIDEDHRFNGCYVIHDPISKCTYANDICVLDDTSCTNYFGLPLLVMISEDENGRDQVLSFSIMMSRTKNDFLDYFRYVKNIIGKIRLFVCDRNKTQISALKEIWPASNIIYCGIHIGRNIRDKVGPKMYMLYEQMRSLVITEDKFIEACKKHIGSHPNTKSAKFLIKLLEEQEHWLPSYISHYVHCGNDTSNRVEGFFGSLKNLIDHKLQPLAGLMRAMYIRGERLLIASMNDKRISLPSDLMSEDDVNNLGTLPLTIIYSEYIDLHERGSLDKEYNHLCCKNHLIYGLPCKHLILQRIIDNRVPLLTIDDIQMRWRHVEYQDIVKKMPNTVEKVTVNKKSNNDWSYSACVDKFEKFFSVAKRSEQVRNILNETLNTLCSIEHQNGLDEEILPPKNLLISGAPECHPRNNVERSGAPRIKRKYRCSICNSDQHTAPRCPIALSQS